MQVTCHLVPRRDLNKFRLDLTAYRHYPVATGMKTAAVRGIERRRYITLEKKPLAASLF